MFLTEEEEEEEEEDEEEEEEEDDEEEEQLSGENLPNSSIISRYHNLSF